MQSKPYLFQTYQYIGPHNPPKSIGDWGKPLWRQKDLYAYPIENSKLTCPDELRLLKPRPDKWDQLIEAAWQMDYRLSAATKVTPRQSTVVDYLAYWPRHRPSHAASDWQHQNGEMISSLSFYSTHQDDAPITINRNGFTAIEDASVSQIQYFWPKIVSSLIEPADLTPKAFNQSNSKHSFKIVTKP